MERQYQQFKDQGVQVLAVNIAQSKFEVQNFVDQYDLTFPVVIDKTKSVMQAYNVGKLPATYLISPDGKVKKFLLVNCLNNKYNHLWSQLSRNRGILKYGKNHMCLWS